MRNKLNRTIFWVIAGVIVFIGIEIPVRLFLFTESSKFEEIRQRLLEEKRAFYISQPYLNYTHNPDNPKNKEINHLGLRTDKEVAFKTHENTYRILFLGGSTTYGDGVSTYSKSFPAVSEKLLNEKISETGRGFKTVECLNAGIHGATSAELLTHYLMKWQYLHPDLVVIHTGVNDAIIYSGLSSYQPDYHNSRRTFSEPPTPGWFGKILLHSRTAGFFIINFIYKEHFLVGSLQENIYYKFDETNLWFPYKSDSMFVPDYNAYYHNLNILITAIKSCNKEVILFPEIIFEPEVKKYSKNNNLGNYHEKYVIAFNQNRKLLVKLSDEMKVPFCAIPENNIRSEYFIDACHMNEKGEEFKAKSIASAIFGLMMTHKPIQE